MKTDLFANIFLKDGRKIEIAHFTEPFEFMYNYTSCKNKDINRKQFMMLLDSLKQDERVERVETWNGLAFGEYINVHTGEVEKLFGI